ncbi:MAG TPA: arylesterase [Hyphomonadaceae bacterium]|nr:arylesterase [Hyphomonadaceae bacterium]
MRRHILMFLFCATLAACGGKPSSAPAADHPAAAEESDVTTTPVAAGPSIVMLGDSLTAGFNLPAGNALPAALQRDFDAKGIEAKFINAGVSGDTSADGLQRYDFSVAGVKPNMLVVALGANDFLNGLPADVPKKNLSAILDKAKADHIPTVLLGVSIPGASLGKREAAFAAIYPDLAKKYDVPYYPDMLGAIQGKPELLQPDGLHPTEAGVEAMAAAITEFLEPLVKDLP